MRKCAKQYELNHLFKTRNVPARVTRRPTWIYERKTYWPSRSVRRTGLPKVRRVETTARLVLRLTCGTES